MDRYVVAGNPVEHSQSPFIHAEFARQTGQRIDYGRVLWPLNAFAESVRALAASGVKGCNITVPFKFEAARIATELSDRAALAQAVNVLTFEAHQWRGDNTDGVGLVRDIQQNAGVSLEGARVLLVGAGGAAAGVLGPLLQARPAVLTVVNRTPDKAHTLVRSHQAAAEGSELTAGSLVDCGAAYDMVINATASSLANALPPVSAQVLRPGTLALDMMYGPSAQPFLDWARQHGATGRDGLGMLVEQAAAAFELWRGVRPQTEPVLAALRRRLPSPAG